MSKINAKNVTGYLMLPGIWPRAKSLFAGGFGYIAFLMAQIYNMVRLLPANHPYLDSKNIGQYGIRHVIGEAANNLVVSKNNWDQLLIFAALLAGIVMLVGQIVLIIVALIFEPAFAQSVISGSLFATPPPGAAGATYSTDVAFLLLDRVFGVPNFFCAAGNVCTDVLVDGRWPFHVALHALFKFYSMGLLIVAVLIFLYFVVTVVAETATSGTPFGERFQNVWVPIRLVVALLLLTPINYGLNSGQYIGLFAAKIGSSFATNGWHRFNRTIASASAENGDRANPGGETTSYLALPAAPDMAPLVQFMSLVHGCAYTYWKHDINHKVAQDNSELSAATDFPPKAAFYIKPYLVKRPLLFDTDSGSATDIRLDLTPNTTYKDAVEFYGYNDIVIRFGRLLEGEQATEKNYAGDVEPSCGELRVKIADLSFIEESDIDLYGGAPYVQRAYFEIVKRMWFGDEQNISNDLLINASHRVAEMNMAGEDTTKKDLKPLECRIGCEPSLGLPSCENEVDGKLECEATKNINQKIKDELITKYQSGPAGINIFIREAWQKYNQEGLEIRMSQEIFDRGWGGAGIWYNTISKINGGFISAVMNSPTPVLYPQVMEEVREVLQKTDAAVAGIDQFNPALGKDSDIADSLSALEGEKKAEALHAVYGYWNANSGASTNENKAVTGNPFIDAINFIFGTHGIFAMRGENANIHPLAQLSAVGKGIINSAIRNIAISTGLSILGGPMASLELPIVGKAADLATSLFSTTAFVGLTAGVVLYYILPLMPFIFFFFAVGGWVKGLFEAMVGIPLWALAHLRIDGGEGLPGEAATNGYFLIFEIFVRPILTVFGLIASTIIFAAQVRALHFLWDLVVDNVGGYQASDGVMGLNLFEYTRGTIDQFFFTIIYTIIVYMMANASFKLIDMVPDNIMRWMGSGISSFGDTDKNPTEGLTRYAATGGMIQGTKVVQAGQQASQGLGNVLGQMTSTGGGPGAR